VSHLIFAPQIFADLLGDAPFRDRRHGENAVEIFQALAQNADMDEAGASPRRPPPGNENLPSLFRRTAGSGGRRHKKSLICHSLERRGTPPQLSSWVGFERGKARLSADARSGVCRPYLLKVAAQAGV
jgi:hypothetical protein